MLKGYEELGFEVEYQNSKVITHQPTGWRLEQTMSYPGPEQMNDFRFSKDGSLIVADLRIRKIPSSSTSDGVFDPVRYRTRGYEYRVEKLEGIAVNDWTAEMINILSRSVFIYYDAGGWIESKSIRPDRLMIKPLNWPNKKHLIVVHNSEGAA